MNIFDVYMNDRNYLVNHKCVILLYIPIHFENEWSYPLINFYQVYVILHACILCLYEWSRLSWQLYVCCPILHVPIYIENEWSYAVINFYQQYVISNVYIGCLYEWSQ